MAPTSPPVSLLSRRVRLPWSALRVPTPVEICLPIGKKHQMKSSATLCPYCQPKLNPVRRWLYTLFLAVDANFRLKLKNRGINDPDIGSGWAYFVENQQYTKHVSQNTNDVEVGRFPLNTSRFSPSIKVTGCSSNFHAVNQANRKSKKDYIASGVVACV